VDLFARLPLANFAVPAPNAVEVAALYGFLLCVLILRKRLHLLMAMTAALLLIAADIGYWWGERYRRTELRVTHLNVGQGDAAVVEFPNSEVLLIDAGGTAAGDFDIGESIVAPFLRGRKILQVDYLMVSHPRIDHYGGMRAIVGEFSPREFWSGAGKGKTSRFEELEDAIERAKATRVALAEGDPCRPFGEVNICVVYAPADKTDDQSVVVRLEHGKVRYLFGADIDKRDEAVLSRKGEGLRSAVLKVPRHGSQTASTAEFIAAVQPALAVVSAGARSRSEAGREEVAERYRQAGAEVLRTYDDGAIIVESDGHKLRYLGYKTGKRGVIALNSAEKD
jgi:competence protein ComEC